MSVYTLKDSRYSSHMQLVALLDPAKTGRKLLDLGCGNGHLARLLAAKGFTVTGVEHPEGFDPAQTRDLEIIPRDLEAGLDPLPGPFDAIVIGDVLEHLRRPQKILEALHPLLSADGAIYASLPNSGNLWFRVNILLGRFPEDDKGLFDRTHLHFWMLRNWRHLFERSGFRFEVAAVTPVPVGLVSPALQWLEVLCYYCAVAWRTLFAYQFLVVAKKK